MPGEEVAELAGEGSAVRGHGTYVCRGDTSLVSCGAGYLERVNKLVSVVPVRGRYGGEVGDLVVGTVVEIAHKAWKVDVGASRLATLALSSVTLPNDAQRIRTHADALAMRALYAEGDVVCCEVMAVHGDGSVHLHTRSNRYGKLGNGRLVAVNSHLVRRLPRHFVALPRDVDVELAVGNNGVVWVQRALDAAWIDAEAAETGGGIGDSDALLSAEAWRRVRALHDARPLDDEAAARCARARNAVAVLGAAGALVNAENVLRVYRAAEAERLAPKDMVAGAHARRLAAVVVGDLAYGARKRRKRRLSDDDDDFALDGP